MKPTRARVCQTVEYWYLGRERRRKGGGTHSEDGNSAIQIAADGDVVKGGLGRAWVGEAHLLHLHDSYLLRSVTKEGSEHHCKRLRYL